MALLSTSPQMVLSTAAPSDFVWAAPAAGATCKTGLLCEEPITSKTGALLSPPHKKSGALLSPVKSSSGGLLLLDPERPQQMTGFLLEEDSTDVGSSASDAETSCSTDNELAAWTSRFRGQGGRLGARNLQETRCARKWGTMLETIIGTPVGKAENAPLLFTCPPPSAQNAKPAEVSDASRLIAPEPRTNSVQAPPGLPSPVRTKRGARKAAGILATPAPSWEKRGARATQTLLATPSPVVGESATTPSYVSWLPISPTKQARIAFMEKAKQDGAPLKIHANCLPETFPSQEFELGVAAKLGPILAAEASASEAEGGSGETGALVSKTVQAGVPVKKRVTPWLFADLAFSMQEVPR